MPANHFIGIDLGTTFSAIARIDEHGMPQIIETAEGDRTTPSVILFTDDITYVGRDAENNMAVFPGQGVECVKRYMGDPLYSFSYRGKDYSAPQIASLVLKKLKEDAEEKLGTVINDAVITVPAYFGDPQRRATFEAGELAGLNVLQLLNEPTAAAYSYGLHRLGKDQRVLVFDLGGGTFDVTIMEIHGNTIEVKATHGDHQLGGKDWDDALIRYMAEKFERQYGINPRSEEADYHILKEKAIAAKISLSTLPKVNMIYGCKGKTLKEEVTRQTLEKITEDLVNQCRILTDLVLEEAGTKKQNIDVVLLAGGSTRMPMVVTMLRDYFGKEPSKDVNPDECVAMGAAIKSALLKKEQWSLPGDKKTWGLPSGITDINVTSHGFGLAVLNEGKLFNSIIIPKNTPYPVEKSRSDYITSYDNQETLDLYVLEGEAEDPLDCTLIGCYQVYDIPKRPQGKTTLRVTYKYNKNQIVEIEAVDLKAKKELPLKKVEKELQNIASPKPVDVALLIDCSGSMSGEGMEEAKKAAIGFLKTFKIPDGSVGLVTFPGGVLQPLTQDFSLLKDKIRGLAAYNGTPMTEALESAQKELFVEGEFDRIIILLTDGAPNDGVGAGASAKRAKERGIRLITIGVSGADESFLKRIATSDSDYYFCKESFELETTFVNIATQLTNNSGYLRKS